MRYLTLVCCIALFASPLYAETILQAQAEHAQNFLERTVNRISYSWEMMKYHFHKGNERLQESSGVDKEKIQDQIKKYTPGSKGN